MARESIKQSFSKLDTLSFSPINNPVKIIFDFHEIYCHLVWPYRIKLDRGQLLYATMNTHKMNS